MKLSPASRLSCWVLLAAAALGLGLQLFAPAGAPWELAPGDAAIRLLSLIGACAFALALDGRSAAVAAAAPRPVRTAAPRPAPFGGRPTSAS